MQPLLYVQNISGSLKGSFRMHSQPPGLSRQYKQYICIDRCVYTVSVQRRRANLGIFCIVAVCTDRHLIGMFPISYCILCNYVFIKLSENVSLICVEVWILKYIQYICKKFTIQLLWQKARNAVMCYLNGFMCFL